MAEGGEGLSDWISALSKDELKKHLVQRGLSDAGIVHVMRERLLPYERDLRQRGVGGATDPENEGRSNYQDVRYPSDIEDSFEEYPKDRGVDDEPKGEGNLLSPRPVGERPPPPRVCVDPPRFPNGAEPRRPVRRTNNSATDVYNIMRKWNLNFSGSCGSDSEAFLIRIEEGRALVPLEDEDIFRSLLFFLTGIALHWFRANRYRWRTWDEFERAWRARFGDSDYQFALGDEGR